jgi:hypothetical protein
MTLDPEFQLLLNSLKADLIIYKDSIKEVAEDIIREKISSHPIFIAHQHIVSVGEMFLDRDELNMTWSINATTLEEMKEKKIILPDREEAFLANYKDPAEYICILLLTEKYSSFVYIPYQVNPNPQNN